jgi:tRNA pseudouridine55 synthase
MLFADKNIGETPLECLERARLEQGIAADAPMTYAGRLDPMAEGKLLLLVGDECKDKERYLGLDKEYEVEVLFGIATDTGDALGLAVLNKEARANSVDTVDLSKYVGKFTQAYPAYSSKTVNGKQLHELARADELPDEMPTKEVEIYSIDLLGKGSVTAAELKTRILGNINLVKGDFRQDEIRNRWADILNEPPRKFETIKIRVKCSSGTYMRSLAERIGKDVEMGAFALSIKRTKICTKQ